MIGILQLLIQNELLFGNCDELLALCHFYCCKTSIKTSSS